MTPQLAPVVGLEPLEQIRVALVDRIEKDQLELPLLPQVANQVLLLANDPKADASRLSSLIQQDQALASQILRIANSPAYMSRSAIVSLQQAIAWLGLNHLGDLALTVSIQNGVFCGKGYEKEIRGLWRQALATALFGKEIARLRRLNVENAFLCGLLHTIGKPVVLHAVLNIHGGMEHPLGWEGIATLMNDYHTQVGAKMAESWQLPRQVMEAIVYYTCYAQAPSSKAPMITCLADSLASHLLDPTIMEETALRDLPVVHDLNFYPEEMSQLLEQREPIGQTVDSMVL